MVRSDLVTRIAEDYPHMTITEVENIIEAFFGAIAGQLNCGGRVELRGFGAFSVRAYEGRNGRNPRNGENVSVPPKRRIYFKPGKAMLERLNSVG